MLSRLLAASCLAGAAVCAPAGATDHPEAVRALLECRAVTDAADRARCMDERLAAFEQALDDGSLAVVDAAEAAAAQQRNFGLPSFNPRVSLPSPGSDAAAATAASLEDSAVEVRRSDDGDIQQLSGLAVSSVQHSRTGELVVVLENGQTWRQTDNRRMPLPPAGEPVTAMIERGSFGSFFMRLNYHNYRMRARRD